MRHSLLLASATLLALPTWLPCQNQPSQGQPIPGPILVLAEQRDHTAAGAPFEFTKLPAPAQDDLATNATFTLLAGQRSDNGAQLTALHDGKLPGSADAPSENFFFAGGSGGRLLIDLGKPTEVAEVNTYSWHPGPRGPQCYTLFAASGAAQGFNPAPAGNVNPATCGWTAIATVDTRPRLLGPGGQHGVSICRATGSLGTCRYLLLDVQATDRDDGNSQTFWSEIDVHGPKASPSQIVTHTADGKYEITLDVSAAPALQVWATQTMLPVVKEWYPKIVALLPGENFTAPTSLSITFENPGRGVAATSGTHIVCAAEWFLQNLDGEAKGAVVHEPVQHRTKRQRVEFAQQLAHRRIRQAARHAPFQGAERPHVARIGDDRARAGGRPGPDSRHVGGAATALRPQHTSHYRRGRRRAPAPAAQTPAAPARGRPQPL